MFKTERHPIEKLLYWKKRLLLTIDKNPYVFCCQTYSAAALGDGFYSLSISLDACLIICGLETS